MYQTVQRISPWLGELLRGRPGKVANAALLREADLRVLERVSDDVLCRVDPDLRIRQLSQDRARLFDRERGDLLNQGLDQFVVAEDAQHIASAIARARAGAPAPLTTAIRILRPGGGARWVDVTVRPLCDAAPGGADDTVLVLHDVSEVRGLRQRLASSAAVDGPANADKRHAFEDALCNLTDNVTGLANRAAFNDALDLEWQRARRDGAPLSLLLIGIGGFAKPFDNVRGGQRGGQHDDDYLRAVADIVAAASRRSDDLAGRREHDDLALLLPRTTANGAANVAEKVISAISTLHLARVDVAASQQPLSVGLGAATAMSCHFETMATPAILLQAVAAALEKARRTRPGAMVAARLVTPAPVDARQAAR